MSIINLDQKLERINLKEFEIPNKIVFNYFDKLPENKRDDALYRAIYIGVLALMEDRLSAFLSRTQNQLGTELESLKLIFDLKKELFQKSTLKGTLAETEIAEFLNRFFKEKNINDKAVLTGNTSGLITNNKTGDIICELNGNPNLRIAIECKFDRTIKLGEIDTKDIFTKKSDTAWSQLLETTANRDSKISLMVFDRTSIDNSILGFCENVGYIRKIGFIVVIDSEKGNYSNLIIGYLLARDIAINARDMDIDKDILSILIKRILKDIKGILNIRSLVEANINNCEQILAQLDKGLMLMEFNSEYLSKFLNEGKISKKDLFDFYQGEEVKQKYKIIEQSIKSLTKDQKKDTTKKSSTSKKTIKKKAVAKIKRK